MTAYHLRFRNLDHRTIAATRDFVIAKPWRATERVTQEAMAQRFVDTLAGIYGMQAPQVAVVGSTGGTYGQYAPWSNDIRLERKVSVVTLLHEFRHAMQHQHVGGYRTVGVPQSVLEDDARAWSLSAFYRAAPRRFRRMVAEGRILHV